MMHNYEFKLDADLTPPMADADTLLAPRALYQQVAERLREQIFNRDLEPGSWIDEQKLTVEYGISRTPLREALKVLAVEGLVTMKVRRGAYVTEMSADDVSQVYRLLGLLESDAAAEVAERASPAEIAELGALHDKLERQVRQRDAFFATNEQFHLRLLAIAGNRWRQQMVGDLRKAGIASGDFKNLPPDLLGSLFMAPIAYLLKAEIKGRKWTDAELDAAADSVLAGWKK